MLLIGVFLFTMKLAAKSGFFCSGHKLVFVVAYRFRGDVARADKDKVVALVFEITLGAAKALRRFKLDLAVQHAAQMIGQALIFPLDFGQELVVILG